MNHDFDQAAVAIFVAMVLDGLDGRVARLTKTQSAFGAEYDSLSDMVSLRRRAGAGRCTSGRCAAWASWAGSRRSSTCAGAALRLARFNTMLDVADKRWFTGHARARRRRRWSRASSGSSTTTRIDPAAVPLVGVGVTVFAGLTMVSNVKYYSFKTINLQQERAVRRDLPDRRCSSRCCPTSRRIVLFAGFVAYAMSGYVGSAWMMLQRRRAPPPPPA